MTSPINDRIGTNPPHVNVPRVPMPRTPGLHSPARPASGKKRARRAPLAPVANSNAEGQYNGAELRAAVRPGADDFLSLPSRMGNRLHYRDGRVTDMRGVSIKGAA